MTDVRDVVDVHAALAAPGRGARGHVVASSNPRTVDAMRAVARVAGRGCRSWAVPAPVAAASAVPRAT